MSFVPRKVHRGRRSTTSHCSNNCSVAQLFQCLLRCSRHVYNQLTEFSHPLDNSRCTVEDHHANNENEKRKL